MSSSAEYVILEKIKKNVTEKNGVAVGKWGRWILCYYTMGSFYKINKVINLFHTIFVFNFLKAISSRFIFYNLYMEISQITITALCKISLSRLAFLYRVG